MMKKTSLMRRIYDSKTFWLIVSLLASLAIWVYITSVESDEYKNTIRGVRVELVGEDVLRSNKNMVVTDVDTSTVTVEIIGPRRIVASLSASDLVAEIDVSKLSQAAYTSQQYTIVYPTGIDTTNIRETGKYPEVVNFMVSENITKSVQVRGSFDGDLAEGYTGESPVFEPATITLTGPEAYLKNVSYAWVSFGENEKELDSTYQVETGYTLMSADNVECSTKGITTSTDTVIATMPLLEVKEVLLTVNPVYGAAANENNVKITVSPETITLAGDSAILSGMNKIVLDTINLLSFESTYTETYTIPIDNDLKNLSGVTEAKVTVEIIGLETRMFKVSNISFINVTDGYTAQIVTESLDVKLRGTAEVLNQIKNENIRAVADLRDYNETTGSVLATVKIYIDGATEVDPVGEYTVSITIKKG